MKTYCKNIRHLLSLMLCCLLIAGCLGLTASADEGGSAAQPETAGPAAEAVEEVSDGSVSEAPEVLDYGSVTVTFDLGDYGTVTESVFPGWRPQNVPGVPEEFAWQGYVVVDWLDENGEPVDPAAAAVTEDTVYTARLDRSVDVLLNTDDHNAYISGVSNEIFNPQGSLTRAEAATLFSNLLRVKDFDHESICKDVKPDDWFAESVGRVNTLGIAVGGANGNFRPHSNITRAEFVKMASACDSLVDAECPFPDVSEDHWARSYIVSAYAKGWVGGTSTGNFNPNSNISRAEAVTILNHMLGREPDPDIKEKEGVRSFCDVFPEFWAYGNIIEAATDHEFSTTEEGSELWQERWTDYTRYEPTDKRGWISANGNRYYVGEDGMCLRGEQTIDGVKYHFDNTGAGANGFFTEGSWKRYYKNGVKVDDISNLGVVKGPYYIKVYKPANYLIIFAKDSSGKYNIPVRAMLTSCGNPTPTGDYYTPGRYRWLEMVGGSWAQWCTQIYGSYLFHSVPNDLRNNYTMWSGEYNNLGTTRSLGCIRLNCEDAKWIYDNCALGTHVYISPSETSGPLKKPAGLKIPSWHTWDPTDPTAKYLCKEHGCH